MHEGASSSESRALVSLYDPAPHAAIPGLAHPDDYGEQQQRQRHKKVGGPGLNLATYGTPAGVAAATKRAQQSAQQEATAAAARAFDPCALAGGRGRFAVHPEQQRFSPWVRPEDTQRELVVRPHMKAAVRFGDPQGTVRVAHNSAEEMLPRLAQV
jgi:hypothetical protein